MDDVMTESRANVVLSSVSIALNNTAWWVSSTSQSSRSFYLFL
jgi:hypothetical protein